MMIHSCLKPIAYNQTDIDPLLLKPLPAASPFALNQLVLGRQDFLKQGIDVPCSDDWL